LAIFTNAVASVVLVADKLSLDALAWVNATWLRLERRGFASDRFDFSRRAVFIGLTANPVDQLALRVMFDVAAPAPHDLHLKLKGPAGFDLIAGQFQVPLGFEAATAYDSTKFIGYSLNRAYWKPGDPLDVGVALAYASSAIDAQVAVVNGNGRNQGLQDDNKMKDAAASVVVAPVADLGLAIMARGYYGRRGSNEDLFYSLGLGANYMWGSLLVVGEAQHSFWFRSRNSFYVQASRRLGGGIEPVARLHMASHWDDKYELGLTFGMNVYLFSDKARLMVDYDYWHKATDIAELRGSDHKVQLQLQGAI
jgi:hypothetical protein